MQHEATYLNAARQPMEECAEKQVGAFMTVVKAEECLPILSKGGKSDIHKTTAQFM